MWYLLHMAYQTDKFNYKNYLLCLTAPAVKLIYRVFRSQMIPTLINIRTKINIIFLYL